MAAPTKPHRPKRRKSAPRSQTRRIASSSISATAAKNEFGRLLERVIKGERVYITRHDSPKAVIISVEDFDALASPARTKINTLSAEFDALLARMQAPGAHEAMKAAFDASPKELAIAAVNAARPFLVAAFNLRI